MGSGVGMTSFSCHRKFSRVVLAATIGMAIVIGCAGSFAQAADDDDDELLDVKIFRGILKGLGLRKDDVADRREARTHANVLLHRHLAPGAVSSAIDFVN